MPTERIVAHWQLVHVLSGNPEPRLYPRRQDAVNAQNRAAPGCFRVRNVNVKMWLCFDPDRKADNGKNTLEGELGTAERRGYLPPNVPESPGLFISAWMGDKAAYAAWMDCLLENGLERHFRTAKEMESKFTEVWEEYGQRSQRTFLKLALNRGLISPELYAEKYEQTKYPAARQDDIISPSPASPAKECEA